MENTALSPCYLNFIDDPELIKKYKQQLCLKEDEPFGRYCSACCPLGKKRWHGKFERVFLPKGGFETSPDGGLRHKETHDENYKRFAIRISDV